MRLTPTGPNSTHRIASKNMCGIAGILYFDQQKRPDAVVLKAMSDAIAHRGPDGEGFYRGRGIGLAHRRLAIIDLEGGRQPLSNEDGTIHIVFNGEIYNYQSLRRTLESKGHRFTTASDTEVLVHLYEEHGEGLVEHLRGMFAFAIWDDKTRTLLLGRDRVGLKPLYIYRDADKLLFGSEIKAILAYGKVDRSVDASAVDEYLYYGFLPADRSIFASVRKLPPAHTLRLVDGTELPARRYWSLQPSVDQSLSEDEWLDAVTAKINDTVSHHLVSDVPVGAFLSGGIDSALMVAMMSDASDSPVHAFSIGFHEEAFSELPRAREIVRHFGCRHTEETVTPDSVSILDDLVHYYDEPFADSSAIPTMYVSRLARQHVKVVISGDGGDEGFGGYSRYAHDLVECRWRKRLPAALRTTVIHWLGRLYPKLDWAPRPLRAKTRLLNLSRSDAAAYANTISLCRQPLRHRLLSADIRAHVGTDHAGKWIRTAYGGGDASDPLSGMTTADIAVLLPDDFLTKVDRASMSCGLEVRPPLVDHELLELASRIPHRFKVRAGKTKWLLRQLSRHRLPPSVTNGPKHGFEIPVSAWLRGPLRSVFEDSVIHGQQIGDYFDQRAVRQLWQAHLRGTTDQGSTLWSLLVFAKWVDCYLNKPCDRRIAAPAISAR